MKFLTRKNNFENRNYRYLFQETNESVEKTPLADIHTAVEAYITTLSDRKVMLSTKSDTGAKKTFLESQLGVITAYKGEYEKHNLKKDSADYSYYEALIDAEESLTELLTDLDESTETITEPEIQLLGGNFDARAQKGKPFTMDLKAQFANIKFPPDMTVTYAVTALPAGLKLDATTGIISGTPTTTKKIDFIVKILGDNKELFENKGSINVVESLAAFTKLDLAKDSDMKSLKARLTEINVAFTPSSTFAVKFDEDGYYLYVDDKKVPKAKLADANATEAEAKNSAHIGPMSAALLSH